MHCNTHNTENLEDSMEYLFTAEFLEDLSTEIRAVEKRAIPSTMEDGLGNIILLYAEKNILI